MSLTHTVCPACRKRMGAKRYDTAHTWHGRLSRERGMLLCRFCGKPMALLGDDDEQEDVA